MRTIIYRSKHKRETEPDAMSSAGNLGNGQSPIDLSGWVASNEPAPILGYNSDAARVERLPGFVMIHFDPGSELTLGEDRYRLLQLHWHTPAEHTIDGDEFAAEVHFVHINREDQLLVVGTVYRLGDADEGLQQIIDSIPPADAADEVPTLSATNHPSDSDGFYHYVGSLTAAPFSEPVLWYVGRSVRSVSQRQVEQLQALCGGPNARPLQDRNERTILCVGCGR